MKHFPGCGNKDLACFGIHLTHAMLCNIACCSNSSNVHYQKQTIPNQSTNQSSTIQSKCKTGYASGPSKPRAGHKHKPHPPQSGNSTIYIIDSCIDAATPSKCFRNCWALAQAMLWQRSPWFQTAAISEAPATAATAATIPSP